VLGHACDNSLPSIICVCGKGRIATSALSYTKHALASWGLDIPLVACPSTGDRGYDTWSPSLIRMAHRLAIPVYTLDGIQQLQNILLVSLEFDRIIKTNRFKAYGLINIHFSPLPTYRGVYTTIWPILNGEEKSGVTLHEIDDGIDTGPIIDQRIFSLPHNITARRLYDIFMDEGFELFKDNLLNLVHQTYNTRIQDENLASYYGRKSLDLSEVEIDLSQSAECIDRRVRGFHFPEYQLPKLSGRSVVSCHIIPLTVLLDPGTVISSTSYSESYVTGDGRVIELVWA
jgi:methionyl-tRNA formyltransferase